MAGPIVPSVWLGTVGVVVVLGEMVVGEVDTVFEMVLVLVGVLIIAERAAPAIGNDDVVDNEDKDGTTCRVVGTNRNGGEYEEDMEGEEQDDKEVWSMPRRSSVPVPLTAACLA